ncbi:MAG: hypothetical protein LJE95_11875 [Acidobacteria bacterium]|jgi:hypothetical protein|nr:hypothetical protein [Acidobacteriota bacterium]
MKVSFRLLLAVPCVVLLARPASAQTNATLTSVGGILLVGAKEIRGAGQPNLPEDLTPGTGFGVEVRREWERDGLGYSLALGYVQRDVEIVAHYWSLGGPDETRTQERGPIAYLTGGMHFHMLPSGPLDLEIGPVVGAARRSDASVPSFYGAEIMARYRAEPGRLGLSIACRYLKLPILPEYPVRGWGFLIVIGATRVR